MYTHVYYCMCYYTQLFTCVCTTCEYNTTLNQYCTGACLNASTTSQLFKVHIIVTIFVALVTDKTYQNIWHKALDKNVATGILCSLPDEAYKLPAEKLCSLLTLLLIVSTPWINVLL